MIYSLEIITSTRGGRSSKFWFKENVTKMDQNDLELVLVSSFKEELHLFLFKAFAVQEFQGQIH